MSIAAFAAFGFAAGCSSSPQDMSAATVTPGAPTASGGVAMTGTPPAGTTPMGAPAAAGNKPVMPGATAPVPPSSTPVDGTTPPPPGSAVPPDGTAPPAPASGATANWLSYGGGYKNQFWNPVETKISVETAPMLKMLWMKTPGEVTAAPVVVGDKIYVGSNAGLFAFTAADGNMLWTAAVRSTSGPYYDEETKMLFSADSGGSIHGIDAETGMEKWTQRISMQGSTNGWSSPIVSGKLVVVGVGAIDMGNFKGGVSAFDKVTGTKAWEFPHTTTNGGSVWSGPGADDEGNIYATSGNNYVQTDDRSDSIFALSPKGAMPEMLWNFQAEMNDGWTFSGGTGPDHDFGANPIILDYKEQKLIACGQKSGEFHLLDRMTGKPFWKAKLSTATSAATGGILNNGAFDGKNGLFITSANEGSAAGTTYALDASPDGMGKIVWMKKNTGLVWGQTSSANGVCFIPDNTTMRVLNCLTGEELNKFDVPGTIGSAAAISDGRVFFGAGFNYSLGSVVGGRSLVALGL